LIAHGAGTCKTLSQLLGSALPPQPSAPGQPVSVQVGAMTLFLVPSLAPPKWNTWQGWADEHLRGVALAVAAITNQA